MSRGRCSHCSKSHRICENGRVVAHQFRQMDRCPGGGRPPIHVRVDPEDWKARAEKLEHELELVLASLRKLPVYRGGVVSALDLRRVLDAAS